MNKRAEPRIANEAWEALFRTHTTLLGQFAADDIWKEVSMREYDVLYTLISHSEQAMRLGQLAERALMPQPSLSRMVERLAQRGLVNRQPAAEDGRGIVVSLTKEGRAVQQRTGLAHARAVTTRMGAGLDDQELAQLGTLCRKLLAANSPDAVPPQPPTLTRGHTTSRPTQTRAAEFATVQK